MWRTRRTFGSEWKVTDEVQNGHANTKADEGSLLRLVTISDKADDEEFPPDGLL